MTWVVERLRMAGCVAAEEEASELEEAAAGGTGALETLVARRERGEPLAWITGTMQFCAQTVHVAPDVYVPRVQSEELARRAVLALPAGGHAADLCTGAGAIAAHIAAADPSALVVGVDIDERAVRCARLNGVRAITGTMGDPLRGRCFDVVTAVAPYVPTDEMRFLPADVLLYEPRHALDGGVDGLDIVRTVVASAGRLLRRPGGTLLVEVGGEQGTTLAPVLAGLGFDDVLTWCDEDGDLRGLSATAK